MLFPVKNISMISDSLTSYVAGTNRKLKVVADIDGFIKRHNALAIGEGSRRFNEKTELWRFLHSSLKFKIEQKLDAQQYSEV